MGVMFVQVMFASETNLMQQVGKNSKWCFLPEQISVVRMTRGAIALRFFPSSRHRKDRLKKQQMILRKKRHFERKMLSMDIVMDQFESI